MSKRNILLMSLLLVGSIVLASNGVELQGAFSNPVNTRTAVLHVGSSGAGETSLDWNTENLTLGKWTVKTDQKLTLNGIIFHIGALTTASSSDNSLSEFFEDCSTIVTSSGQTVEILTSSICNNAYTDLTLESGKTYAFTLKATGKRDAVADFIDSGYDGQEVALSFMGLTVGSSAEVRYNESTFTNLSEQEESAAIVESGKKVTLEYTFGGYTLKNIVKYTEGASNSPSIGETQSIPEEKTSVKTNTADFESDMKMQGITVSIPETSAVTKELTIKISTNGSTVKISNGTDSKTCTSILSGNYSCKIP